jgi:hypothetical protein
VGRTLLSDAFAIGVLAPFLCWIEKERIAAQVNLCHSDRSFAFPQGKGSAVEEPAVPDRTPEDRRRRPLPSQTRLPEWIAPCSCELQRAYVGTAALGCPRAEGPSLSTLQLLLLLPWPVQTLICSPSPTGTHTDDAAAARRKPSPAALPRRIRPRAPRTRFRPCSAGVWQTAIGFRLGN